MFCLPLFIIPVTSGHLWKIQKPQLTQTARKKKKTQPSSYSQDKGCCFDLPSRKTCFPKTKSHPNSVETWTFSQFNLRHLTSLQLFTTMNLNQNHGDTWPPGVTTSTLRERPSWTTLHTQHLSKREAHDTGWGCLEAWVSSLMYRKQIKVCTGRLASKERPQMKPL